jgi:hypothetical protein
MNLLAFEMLQLECLPPPYHNNPQCKDGYPVLPKQQKIRRLPKMEQSFSNLNQTILSTTL